MKFETIDDILAYYGRGGEEEKEDESELSADISSTSKNRTSKRNVKRQDETGLSG